MTRITRAKGSKATSEGVPETATPLSQMKKQQQKQKKVTKTIVTEEDVTDEMVESDEELDETSENASDDEDDAPEEQPSKQAQTKNQQKRKVAKPNEANKQKRRKVDLVDQFTVKVNGETKKITRFDGFPVLQADHDRLVELRKSLAKKGVPESEVKRTLQTERRKAEKYLSRLKKYVCFNCRKSGHVLSECPDLGKKTGALDQSGTGICFKCGSAEHKVNECKSKDGQALKYASCFICRKQGHLARECPDNPRGLYPKGGACRQCGDVTHLKKDCPQNGQSPSEKNDAVEKKTTKNQKKNTKNIV